jgi:hypothetical protein
LRKTGRERVREREDGKERVTGGKIEKGGEKIVEN